MNKNLTQMGQQLLAIWKQLGLNQRVTIVMSTLALLAGLIGVAAYSSRQDYALLYGKLDEAEAAKVLAALDEQKVSYKIGAGGGSILVPSDKVYQLRMELAGKGIPRGEGVGFEIFDKANFGISDFVQRANYSRAVQGELSRTISQLEGVSSARVMIVMPENRLLTDAQRKPTASVFVNLTGNGVLSASAVNSIRFLVANSVEGLTVNNVSISDNHGNMLSENQDGDSPAGLSDAQLTARRNLEQYLTKKAQGMLETVLGAGQAVVRVSAEMNWDSIRRTETKYDPEGSVPHTTTINDENTESATGNPTGGAPGAAANSASDGSTNGTSVTVNAINSSKTKKKVTNNTFDNNSSTSEITQASGGIKHLSTAVFIAQKFEGTGKERKAVPRTPEELQKLTKIVSGALGIVENDPLRKDQITLEEMPFNDQAEVELSQKFEKQEKSQFWMGLLEKIMYPALAIGMIALFWRTFKTAKFEEIPVGFPVGEGQSMSLGANNNGSSGKQGGFGRNNTTPGVVSVDVLNQLIRENPTNMTQAVRSWLTAKEKTNN